tara:strand:- start:4952 stop:5662 length:711 start_codon:yes stop_codon:yes gene_type:complete
MSRDFKGIWIPKEIWLSKDLTLQEKVFLVEISSLDNSKGCYANNKYFSDFFGISKTRVSLVIKSLVDKKYITSKIIYKEGSKQILNRVLNISYRPYLTKVKEPTQQKLKDNNTVNNTVNKISKKTEIVFLEQVHNCFDNCLNYFPEHLQPKTEKIKKSWLNTIDKLNRIDKIPFEEIERITENTRKDKFWSKNFLTLNKLRKKNKEGILYIVVFNESVKPKKKNDFDLIRKNIEIF